MCLIKGRQNETCLHHWCELAAKQPKYWSDFKSDYIMNEPGLKSFKLSNSLIGGKPYILPVNPFEEGTKERNKFEIFRQAMGTHTDCFGYWPADRDKFDKSEVEFVMIEVVERVPESGCYSEGSPLIDRPDLKEFAIYVGEGSTHRQLIELDNYTVVYDITPKEFSSEYTGILEYVEHSGIPLMKLRHLSPASMVIEGKAESTTPERRLQILEAFKKGVKAMQSEGLPPDRVMFIEYQNPVRIEIWID